MSCTHAEPLTIISRARPHPLHCRHCGARSADAGATWTTPREDAPTKQAIPVYGGVDAETLARRDEQRRALLGNQGEGDWVTRL